MADFFRLFFFNVLFLKYSPTGIQLEKKKKDKVTKHHRKNITSVLKKNNVKCINLEELNRN